MQPPITDTGVKGFLKWLQRDQPVIYARVAPALPTVAPRAFSGYAKRMRTLRGIYRGSYTRPSQALGQYSDYTSAAGSSTYASTPVTVNYSSQLSAPISYQGDPAYTTPTPSSVPIDTGSTSGAGSIANAANSGSSTASTVGAIGSAISSVASQLLSAANMSALMNLVSAQLGKAQAGTSPSNVSSKSLGIPTAGATSTTTILVLLALVGGAAWVILE
jgi:hypothetical protein